MARRLLLALIAVIGVASAASAPGQTGTRAGAYTDVQAEAGSQLYAVRCAMCHGRMLEGTFETPGLQGRFIANWSMAPLSNLYDYLGRAMPQFAPGSLTPEESAQLVAFLLKSNALPAGSQPLPASSAALQQVVLEPMGVAAAAKER